MSWIIAGLAIIGAGLELLGIWLTVQDLRKAATSLRQYDKEGHNLWIAPFPAHARSSGSATLSGGSEPPVETRLKLVEAEMAAMPDRLAQLEDRLRTEWQNSISGALQASENTLNDRITRLRNYVLRDRSISTGSRWWVGPGVVAVGIVFSCVSDVLSALR